MRVDGELVDCDDLSDSYSDFSSDDGEISDEEFRLEDHLDEEPSKKKRRFFSTAPMLLKSLITLNN